MNPHTLPQVIPDTLTPNKADSTHQTGNGPCGTKTHMVAAYFSRSATFNHSNQMSVSQEVSKMNVNQHNHASQTSLQVIGYKTYN